MAKLGCLLFLTEGDADILILQLYVSLLQLEGRKQAFAVEGVDAVAHAPHAVAIGRDGALDGQAQLMLRWLDASGSVAVGGEPKRVVGGGVERSGSFGLIIDVVVQLVPNLLRLCGQHRA